MSWARIDDGFHDHPKVDELDLAAVGLWTLCLTWAHRHRRTAIVAGHITVARVRKVASKQGDALAEQLVRAGLWDPEPNIGGWVIHDFGDYLPKQRDPSERREAGRKGAAKRWEADSKLPSQDMATDSSRASAPASPSRPVPLTTQDQDLGGERPVTLPPTPAPELPPSQTATPADARCTNHRGVVEPGPCKGCQASRERAEALADREAEKRQRLVAAAVRNCPDCNGSGVREDETGKPVGRCAHRNVRVAS